jgi:hypothetical protein
VVAGEAIELRFKSSDAREAFAQLKREAESVGLRIRYKNSKAMSAEFVERDGEKPFSTIANDAHLLFYLRQPILRRVPNLFRLAENRFGKIKANHLGEYRIRVRDPAELNSVIGWLRSVGAWDAAIKPWPKPALRPDGNLPADLLEAVTPEHLFIAGQMLSAGYADHDFGEHTDYEVVFQAKRLKPKAMFGVAASRALGFRVLPGHFHGGLGTQCFRKIESADYEIVRVGSSEPKRGPRLSDEDRRWAEGNPRLVTHLRKERARGLAKAKKSQFLSDHGRLFCERCKLDPVRHFKDQAGNAAIEVHHRATAVAGMDEGHETVLADLQCLCANCHRFIHRLMKLGRAI